MDVDVLIKFRKISEFYIPIWNTTNSPRMQKLPNVFALTFF